MAESKSVVIRLTNEQREAIKRATGKDITELKVDALEGRITPAADYTEFRKAPALDEVRKAPALDEVRKAPALDEIRKAPALDEIRKAPAMDEIRKAPSALDVDKDSVEQRKAPFMDQE